MADKTVAQKLLIKEGRTVLIVNAPKEYASLLGNLPERVILRKQPSGPADLIQVFVKDRKALEDQLIRLRGLLNPNGILWVTYPKGTSKIKADINRDSINAYAKTIGLQGVAMIAIDEDWSALRLKPV